MRKFFIFLVIFEIILLQSAFARTFWAVKDGTPYQVEAELRKTGTHCYIYVAKDIENQVLKSDIKNFAREFDENIWPKERNFFGDPPDVDRDSKIYILILDIPDSDPNAVTLGYFWPDQEQSYDKIEILYIDYIWGKRTTLAHEFNHMIHYNYDKDEEPWIDEGLATFAEFYVYKTHASQKDSFLSNPDTTLVETNRDHFGVPNYGASYLFMLYLRDQYEEEIVKNILQDSGNGINSINNHLPSGIDFETVFKNWIIANYLDSPDIDSKYNYQSIEIKGEIYVWSTSCNPLKGAVTIKDLSPVNKWAADYIKVKLEENNFLLTSTFKGNTLSNLFSTLLYENNLTWFDISSPLKMTDSIQTEIGDQTEVIYIVGRKDDLLGTGQYEIELSAPFVDVVLVIDRSGSMWGSKIVSAKNSAKMFVDLMQVNDKVGVVSFSHNTSVDYPLTRIDTTSTVKTVAKNAIGRISAWGMTSIGGGLQTAQNQLTTKGADDPVWAIVLLSDGWENTSPYVRNVLPSIAATKTRIYTVGLGQGADEALLNTIALTTGGFYRFSPSGAELAAIYQDIQRAVAGLQGIVSYLSNILQGVTKSFSVGIDSSVLRAVFTATIGGSDIDLVLIAPDGTVIDPSVAATDPNITFSSGDNYESYSIISPMPGHWQMQVSGVDVAPGGEQITVSVSGSTDLTLDIDFDKIEYLPDEPITIIAELKDSLGPILGASVMANVTTPSTADTLTLYDDGLHQDGAANDGVYANSYTNTSQRGSYTFKVDASGISNRGENFTRTATKSTVVGRDSDNDGMPDVWEDIYGLNKYRDDAGEDPDNDGLTNLEEYLNRTNPKNWDTDGDGYSDGEEVAKGSDPLNPNSVPTITGDLDNDGDVDQNDLNLLLTYRNQSASACPECDIDGDGIITVLDARKLVLMCTRPRCATE